MPNPRKSLPRYLKHSSGKARIVWTDATGTRREKILPGAYDSAESREAFARLQLELATSPAPPPVLRVTDTGPTVAEILLPYLTFAKGYYTAGDEYKTILYALRPVRELYGSTPAAEFGPRALAAVRETMVRKGWSRQYCNRQCGRVIRAFKWAAGEELLAVTAYQSLKTLSPLKTGKTEAPESERRRPVPVADYEATLPHLAPHVKSLVQVIRYTGARPSEVCRMTLGQIDRSKELWVYTPTAHKNAHRGKARDIPLGPKAQAVILEHLAGRVPGPDDPLFSPARQREVIFEAKRTARRSKVQPSQVSRKKAGGKRMPGEWFVPAAVCRAVLRAAKTAGVKGWTPYALRHLRGTEAREQHGIESARALLGQSFAAMADHYSRGADAVLAAEVAAKTG